MYRALICSVKAIIRGAHAEHAHAQGDGVRTLQLCVLRQHCTRRATSQVCAQTVRRNELAEWQREQRIQEFLRIGHFADIDLVHRPRDRLLLRPIEHRL